MAGTWSLTGDVVRTSWQSGGAAPATDDLAVEVERLGTIVGRPLSHDR